MVFTIIADAGSISRLCHWSSSPRRDRLAAATAGQFRCLDDCSLHAFRPFMLPNCEMVPFQRVLVTPSTFLHIFFHSGLIKFFYVTRDDGLRDSERFAAILAIGYWYPPSVTHHWSILDAQCRVVGLTAVRRRMQNMRDMAPVTQFGNFLCSNWQLAHTTSSMSHP